MSEAELTAELRQRAKGGRVRVEVHPDLLRRAADAIEARSGATAPRDAAPLREALELANEAFGDLWTWDGGELLNTLPDALVEHIDRAFTGTQRALGAGRLSAAPPDPAPTHPFTPDDDTNGPYCTVCGYLPTFAFHFQADATAPPDAAPLREALEAIINETNTDTRPGYRAAARMRAIAIAALSAAPPDPAPASDLDAAWADAEAALPAGWRVIEVAFDLWNQSAPDPWEAAAGSVVGYRPLTGHGPTPAAALRALARALLSEAP